MAKAAVRRVAAAVKFDWSGVPDRELLRRFTAEGDQGAFAALVRRHTNLVLGVCRRAVLSDADAEDACQAVFLILARKAKSDRWQTSIVNWLYTTSRRVADKARRAATRRTRREASHARPETYTPGEGRS